MAYKYNPFTGEFDRVDTTGQPAENRFPITPYVVGPVGQAGYQTIQSAIDAIGASGTGNIWIQPGTYTEDLNFPSASTIGLVGTSDEQTGPIIVGTHTPASDGDIVTWRVAFTSTGHVFDSNSAGTGNITVVHNNMIYEGYLFNLPNWTATGSLTAGLIADRDSTESGIVNNTGGTTVFLFQNSLGNGTMFPMIVSGEGFFERTDFGCPITCQGSGSSAFYSCQFENTLTVSSSHEITAGENYFLTGANEALIYNSSGDSVLNTCGISSSHNPAIDGTGSGTLTLSGVSFDSNAVLGSSLTIAGGTTYSGTYKSDYTDHGVILGQGEVEDMVSSNVGTDGQVFLGATSADPAFATLTSTGGTVTFTPGPNSLNLETSASINEFPITPFVVGPVGDAGYQTIQDALDAANAAGGGVVGVQPGTYTENLTLYDNTQVVGFGSNGTITAGSGGIGPIVINGTHTPPTSGQFIFKNVSFTSAGSVISSAAGGTATIKVDECAVGVISGYLFDLDNWGGEISLVNSTNQFSGNRGINNSVGAAVIVINSDLGSVSASSSNLGGTNDFYNSTINVPVAYLGGSDSRFYNCNFQAGFTTAGTCDVTGSESLIENTGGSAITHNSSGPVALNNCTVLSGTNPSIAGTGAGAVDLTGIVFLNDDNIAGALTISSGTSYSGTLKTDYTDHGVILGQGSETNMVATSAGTDGQVFLGATGADPAFATLTSTGSTIDFTLGANSLNLDTASEVSNSFPTDSGTATPSSGALTVAGGTNINTSGASSTVTVNLDGDVLGLTDLTVDNLELNGNTISSTDTNGNVVISPDGTGVVSVTTAAVVPSGDRADSLGSATNSWDNVYCDGVTFDDGTNVLSAYEEGTWTPTLAFGGGSTGITYSSQTGRYTRIGRVVFIQCDISLSSKGTDTGAATFTLPIATGADSTFLLNMQCTTFADIPLGGTYTNLSVALQTSSTNANLNMSDPAGTSGYANVTDAEFNNTGFFRFSGFYFV